MSGKKYKCRIIVNESSVPGIDYSSYLIATKNCQVGHASIKKQTDALCNGLTTDNAKAEAIFNFVRDEIKTVSYEENEIRAINYYYYNVIFGNETKYGAVGTLSAKEGNDADKTHLLIAMLRTAGIPARYCYGSCKFNNITRDIALKINNEE